MTKERIAVVIPAYNEARTIAQVVGECFAHSDIVIVVDDGSNDETRRCASQAGARVLSNPKNEGVGAALKTGLQCFCDSDLQAVVTLDGDGVHDPSHIPELVRSHTEAGADLTIGTRFSNGYHTSAVPSAKSAANYFATTLINTVLHCNLTDVASGMRVFSRRALASQFGASDYAIAFEFIAVARRNSLRIHEHEISVRYDAEELFCTGRGEFLNLLSFAITNTVPRDNLSMHLEKLQDMAANFERMHLRVKGENLILHPIKQYDAYAFQFQHPWYGQLGGETLWLTLI